MFRFFAKQSPVTNEPYSSALYDEHDFYRAFVSDLSRATRSVVIESPYLTARRASELSDIFKKLSRLNVSVRIYTREPSHHDKLLELQSYKATRILKASGARVFFCSDMRHRKIATVDNTILWEGSLNILSQSQSREIMRRTVSKEICHQMTKFIKTDR